MWKRKWDYQENYSPLHCILDEIEHWIWRHAHWLWWGYQGIIQWYRDKEEVK